MESRYRKAMLFAFLVWLCSNPVVAQPNEPLTLQAALKAALASNPRLQVYPFRVAALRGEKTTAALPPPFQVNTTLEDAFGTGSVKGINAAELTLSLSHVVELGGKRAARIGAVSRRIDLIDAQQRIDQLDLMAEVTRRFIAVASAQQELALQQRAVALAQQTLANVQTLVTAAQVPVAEQQRATAALAQAVLEQGHADAMLQAARFDLAGMWASRQAEFTTVSADLMDVGAPGDLNTLLLALEDNPDIQLFASEERMQQAELAIAQSERRNNVQWTAGIRHLSEAGDTGFVVGASMPLGSERRASGAIATAQAGIDEVASRRADALNRIRTGLSVLHVQLVQAISEANGLREQVLPPLNSALEQTRAAYLGGRYGYLELVSAQRDVLAAEQALIDAAATTHLLRAEIERLGGAALDSANAE